MEPLCNREVYGPGLAMWIEGMGTIAVSIANRWQMGWPQRVQALLDGGNFQVNLDAQVNKEKDVLADAVDLQHLTHREILQMHEIQESPPAEYVVERDGVSFIEGDAISNFPAFVTFAQPPTPEQMANIHALRGRQAGWR
ncbi:MAG TPA: hypothetical protein PLE48_17440 [Thiobacillus sp.]|jgi:hypothetical protein|uniref:hypothetical protein n=1 Tax=unclassified Acidovorax TaxID=2684926 RepID=UPI0025BF5F94|nr:MULTISPECIES: hypothetical protein [unclassified Acidovorax]HQS65472.1 hypothetical protein [Acidovorax defluvii]HQT19471.1 hypothetical protein [Acidovorax defluvii]HQT72191.1 hypothetical protein [Thiobacillus sp.]